MPFSSQPSPVYIFQPTPPAREETCGRINGGWERWAISTRSSRTGGDQAQDMQTGGADYISTHSSRTGGDPQRSGKRYQRGNFNPLLPHGRRPICLPGHAPMRLFQSTPPAREETSSPLLHLSSASNFNPLLPHGRRRLYSGSCAGRPHFNPLLPHGRRLCRARFPCQSGHFNPLLPHGRRPHKLVWLLAKILISIHSSRTGGDAMQRASSILANPFQSTPPAREETLRLRPLFLVLAISIHSSRTGGDARECRDDLLLVISIHSSRTGGDGCDGMAES